MKKTVSGFVLGALCVLVVGCGGGGGSSPAPAPDPVDVSKGVTDVNNLSSQSSVSSTDFGQAVTDFQAAYDKGDPQGAAGYALSSLAEGSLAAYQAISGTDSVPVTLSLVKQSPVKQMLLSVNYRFASIKARPNPVAASISTVTGVNLGNRDGGGGFTLGESSLVAASAALRALNIQLHNLITGPLRDSYINSLESSPLQITDPSTNTTVSIGKAEMLSFRSSVYALAGVLDVIDAYSYDIGSFDLTANPNTVLAAQITSGSPFPGADLLPPSPFLTVIDNRGAEPVTFFENSATDIENAVTDIQGRTGTAFLLNPSGLTNVDLAKISADGATVITWLKSTQVTEITPPSGPNLPLHIDAGHFLANLPHDAKALLPTVEFAGDGSTVLNLASIPDPTFGGVFPNGTTEIPALITAFNVTVSGTFITDIGGDTSWMQLYTGSGN